MRAAVTGAAGFIGAYLARSLAADGHEVVAIDNLLRGQASRLDGVAGIRTVRCDVRDAAAVGAAVTGCDVVFHLAAINGTENFYNHPDLVLDVGVRGVLAVIDACRAAGVADLIIASSAEVYQTPPMVPTDETVPLVVPDVTNPRYSYGGSKLISELIALHYGKDHFNKVAIFRPHNVYGPDMGWKHVIPQLAVAALKAARDDSSALPIQGDGSETRAFCYVDDIVRGIRLIHDAGADRQIYHIGTGEEVPIRHVAETIVHELGLDLTLAPGPAMPGGTPRRCPDIGKLAALGYRPQVALTDGLKRTVAWYRDHAEADAGNTLL
jgi:UDP-glucose 4-epimerase